MCAKNVGTKEELTFTTHDEIKEFINRELPKGAVFIGHNAIKFDVPVVNRLCDTRIPVTRIIDTLVLSMVYSPSLADGHSLDAWGARLKYAKGNFSDWSKLSDEMITYCRSDVELTYRLFVRLTDRMRTIGFKHMGLETEHKAWHIINKQRVNGFAFNQKEAHVLYSLLIGKADALRDKLYKFWPPELKEVAVFKKPVKKNGEFSANYQRHLEQYPDVRLHDSGDAYSCWDYVEFNLGSPLQRITKLQELGWVPREFTKPTKTNPNGNPKVTEKGELVPSLEEFIEESGNEQVRLLAEWIIINTRAAMINTWLDAYNEETGCIHGDLWLANTLRYRHSNPNTANIPAVRVGKTGESLRAVDGYWTYEARDLWGTRNPRGRRLVGVDAKGIQLRVLAHYLNNPEFTKQLLEGDPHEYNRQIAGIETRPRAKTFIYAFLLGAGDAKVGQIVGGTTAHGRKTKRRFINNFPGLAELLTSLKGQVERTGRIVLCDGTPVIVTAAHTVLGYLLQGDESRIMKLAMILVDQEVRKQKLDVLKVGDIHDEWQFDVATGHVDAFVRICSESFALVRDIYGYRIPLDCDAKVGLTWAETH